MPVYLMASVTLPAGSVLAKVKVACSLSGSSETVAVWPATATETKVISAAFRVMVFEGFSRATVMVSSPVKVAALRSGVRMSV